MAEAVQPLEAKTISEPPKAVELVTEPRTQPRAQGTEAEAKAFIYFKESANRTNAINPDSGACGLGQALPCSKLPCSLSDYGCQDAWFTKYAMERYGSWREARSFWDQHKWW